MKLIFLSATLASFVRLAQCRISMSSTTAVNPGKYFQLFFNRSFLRFSACQCVTFGMNDQFGAVNNGTFTSPNYGKGSIYGACQAKQKMQVARTTTASTAYFITLLARLENLFG